MNNKGFSLIELIVVIVVAAIATSMGIISYNIVNSRNVQKAAKNFEKSVDEARTVSMAKGTANGILTLHYEGNILYCGVNGTEREICNGQVGVFINGVTVQVPSGTTISFNTAGQATSTINDLYFLRGQKGCKVTLNKIAGKAETTYYSH